MSDYIVPLAIIGSLGLLIFASGAAGKISSAKGNRGNAKGNSTRKNNGTVGTRVSLNNAKKINSKPAALQKNEAKKLVQRNLRTLGRSLKGVPANR